MGKEEMSETPILPLAATLPNPLYVVFCRLVFDQNVANDELAAMQQVLFDAADETAADPRFQVCVVRPSPYGRFFGLPQAAVALTAAQNVMDRARERGVRLAIGVAAGERLEQVPDMSQQNVIGPSVNLAARLAFHPESIGRILVALPVAEDAQRDAAAYRNCFGPATYGKVKQTTFTYKLLLRQTGTLPSPPSTAERLAAGVAVVYDIEHFSQEDLDGQLAAYSVLNRCVKEQLQAVNAADMMRDDRLWYAPAGDGGGLVFDAARADVAWTFARLLAEVTQDVVPIRIGIATGTVAVLVGSLPVGAAVLRADALSSYAPAGGICVSKVFWDGRKSAERKRWRTVAKTLKPEHAAWLTEALVLEPTGPQTGPQPSPKQPAVELSATEQPQPTTDPSRTGLTLRQLVQKGLLNALVTAYPEQTSASMLLLAVGFPMHQIASFQKPPEQAWLEICQQIARGAHPGAFEPLLTRAAQDYPHNPAFAPFARRSA
jgi:class 3 adenylate cyclase